MLTGLSGLSGLSSVASKPTPSTFLDNMNGTAGTISGNADTGELRSVTNGVILLSGDGAAYLDGNSPDIALLEWQGLVVADQSRFKATLSSNGGDSPIVMFNMEYFLGTAWGLYINDDDDRVLISDYTSIIPLTQGSYYFELQLDSINPLEGVEVTCTLNNNAITVYAKGVSNTFTVAGGGGRPYRNQTGFGVMFNQYEQNRRLHKAEVV